jgi:hypothetical protein
MSAIIFVAILDHKNLDDSSSPQGHPLEGQRNTTLTEWMMVFLIPLTKIWITNQTRKIIDN